MEITIVTGISGAGKTEALKRLEDIGYYSIDNMPPEIISRIVDLSSVPGSRYDRVSLVVDARGGKSFDQLFKTLEELNEKNVPYRILFLDAANEVLVRRFKESSRSHPLARTGRVVAGIAREREIMQPVKEKADVIVDTSDMNVHDLREKIGEIFAPAESVRKALITIISFGYKYGLPLDADIIMDVRFLPNPYWVTELRDKTGLEKPVYDFIADREEAREFINKFTELIESLLDLYEQERKAYLTIGVGCTGGRHRSVVVAEELGKRFKKDGFTVNLLHRDMEKS